MTEYDFLRDKSVELGPLSTSLQQASNSAKMSQLLHEDMHQQARCMLQKRSRMMCLLRHIIRAYHTKVETESATYRGTGFLGNMRGAVQTALMIADHSVSRLLFFSCHVCLAYGEEK